MNPITVIIQAVQGRGEVWERSKRSIEASDIGQSYERMINPPSLPPRSHFLNIMGKLAESKTDLVLRLEDDAVVNKHILYNCLSWPEVHETDFGAGWLFAPGTSSGRWDSPELHGSVGVLMKREDLKHLIPRCVRWFKANDRRLSQDIALSRAVWMSGKRIYIHDPPLVEHPIDTPSTLNHKHTVGGSTTMGNFNAEWRR